MPLYVNTNISSLNAQRQLVSSGMQLDQASERLSSGRRINTAADDAAGLAISNRQTSQIRGLDQAVRNANDGISLIQTAEGALSESTNILQRMRELAIQSANGIYGDGDRATLDAEVQQLVSELDRIATSTSFNGQNILDGTLGDVALQVGSEANQTVSFEVQAVDADTLGMGSLSADVVGANIALATQATLDEQDILINGQAVGAIASQDTMDEITTQINENVLGVTASSVIEINGSSVGTGVVGTAGISIALVKGDGLTTTITVANTESLSELASKIVDESGGLVSASIGDDGALSISAEGGRTLTVTDAGGVTGLSTTATQAQLILTSDNGDPITIERGATGTLQDLQDFGFRETDSAGVIEGVGLSTGTGSANEKLAVGDLTVNGVEIGVTDTSSLAGKIEAINDVSEQTGVTAQAYSTVTIDMSGYISSNADNFDQLEINGIAVDLALAVSATTTAVVTAFNTHTDDTGVSARLNGNSIILESDSGAIRLAEETAGASFLGTAIGVQDLTKVYMDDDGVFVESTTTITSAGADQGLTAEAGLKLSSANGNPISLEFGDTTTAAELASRLGLREANSLGEGSFGSSLSSVSIDTAANAQKAIGVIDNALETVNDIRSNLGAVSNRLDFTISNLSNVSENTSAARSRITDADFAQETANLSRAQVLQQASQAMLAQANARPQQVLSLLQ